MTLNLLDHAEKILSFCRIECDVYTRTEEIFSVWGDCEGAQEAADKFPSWECCIHITMHNTTVYYDENDRFLGYSRIEYSEGGKGSGVFTYFNQDHIQI